MFNASALNAAAAAVTNKRRDHRQQSRGQSHEHDQSNPPLPGLERTGRPCRPVPYFLGNAGRLLPAGTPLHARTRTQVAGQASAAGLIRPSATCSWAPPRWLDLVGTRGRRAITGGSAVRSSPDCDLIASILNPNRIFSATDCQETEITNKLVLVFNKFARTMASMGRSPGWGEKAEPVKTSVTGGGHGKDSS